ncbi:UNVERIFIED_CONTAM: pSer/pThr/pTyr-binding forkhead associated (FHA) protein [Acetivibrio alkalicellulosi]
MISTSGQERNETKGYLREEAWMKKISSVLSVKRKLNKYLGKGKAQKAQKAPKSKMNKNLILIIDILITLTLAGTVYYIYFVNEEALLKYLGYVAISAYGLFLVTKITAIVLNREKTDVKISKLILLDEDGANAKTWNIKGKVSLLIGKQKTDNEVDIDLSDSEYASLVSRQHAVLNFDKDVWYIEDLGSSNGSGIQRASEKTKFKLEQGKPYNLEQGDIIFIANTKILVN